MQNKILGQYDWQFSNRAGAGLAWAVMGFVLPMLVWAFFIFARVQGVVAASPANLLWVLVWLLFSLPCLMIAAKCFGWKGKTLVLRMVFFLVAFALLSIPTGLWVAYTIVDMLR